MLSQISTFLCTWIILKYMYVIEYKITHCAASLQPYCTWWKNMDQWPIIMRRIRNLDGDSTVYGRALIVLQKWQYTGVPWLSCRNGMRDPVVVGLHVWRGEDGREVETGELWQGRQVSQDHSSGLAEFWCKFPEIVSKSITLSFNTTTYLNAK